MDGSLVAVMVFIKHGDGVYELNRFAATTSVVGGFSKLLTHFKRSCDWKQIFSYADRRWSEGGLYETNGFKRHSITKPSYWYLTPQKDARIHRSHFRHDKLAEKFANYDSTLTEFENCDRNGILRVWDCGLIKYVQAN